MKYVAQLLYQLQKISKQLYLDALSFIMTQDMSQNEAQILIIFTLLISTFWIFQNPSMNLNEWMMLYSFHRRCLVEPPILLS